MVPGAGALLQAPFAGLRSHSPGQGHYGRGMSQLYESEQTGIFLYISSESTG